MADYKSLKVADLKAELTRRNLATTGKKEDLITRLEENDKSAPANATETPSTAAPMSDSAVPAPKLSSAQVGLPLPNLGATSTAQTGTSSTGVAPSTAPTSDAAAAAPPSGPSLDEKAATIEAQLKARAARFGTSVSSATPAGSQESAAELEKRKQRAARFGIPLADDVVTKEKAEKLAKASLAQSKREKKVDAGRKKKEPQQQQPPPHAQAAKEKTEKRTASVLDDPLEAEKARKRALKFGNGAASTAEKAAATPSTATTATASAP
jgi:SAP domain-containing ribonucleoprotein